MRNLFLFFFALFFSISLNSLSNNLNSVGNKNFPYWILLEKGRQFLYSKSELGKSNLTHAINYLQEALLRKGVYPEASYYLSVAYSMSGNAVLEKLNLYKSFEDKDYLLDESFEKKILFSLAKMAELENNYVDTIDYLNDILNKFSTKKDYYSYHDYSQSENGAPDNKFNVSFYLTSYLKQVRGAFGLDFTFNLYRFKNYNVIDTHQLLSKVYLRLRAYELSIIHGLIATVGILTRMYDYISYYEPVYQFKNLRSFVKKINEYKAIKNAFESTDFWEIVYNVAVATYAYSNGNYRFRAIDTWKLIVDLAPRFSPYIAKSRSEIKNYVYLKKE
ncbi:hypothetical protein QIA37_01005 [Borrelia sp. CA_690]|uniref:Tetratricopeptide repeat family protein n=1 Tax=Borrelia maritima TaxID=2761123 RepID=A0A5J6W991_9SPIR|nr:MULTISPECIES: hypothetical protein [Borrelia]QFI14244.1 hypothetical protein DB723_00430 [Borrelia maritima]WKC84098.1 hypothetical protein QIA37_01005 [Borrelia sp. CA_690]